MSTNALYRPLLNGNAYNGLFPVPKGTKVTLGKGDTHKSIELIVKWVLQYNSEAKEVATKLKKKSLEHTCLSIHDFLYNHFQYKADGDAQVLRSPAIAWKNRYDGIDCKSYSIIASSILLQLNIKHYIRKIKQPNFNAENFTHVYVIVPVDQITGSLAKGYYTIDGTLKSTVEPVYTEKKDTYMDSLQHYGLNGISEGEIKNALKSKLASFKDVSFKSFGSFFKSLSCIGGSAYDSGLTAQNIDILNNWFLDHVVKINEDVANNNSKNLGFLVAELKVSATLFRDAFQSKLDTGWKSACTRNNFHLTIGFCNNWAILASSALMDWVNENHTLVKKDIGKASMINTAGGGYETSHGLWGLWMDWDIAASSNYNQYAQKSQDIKAFLPTIEDIQASVAGSFDIKKFLDVATTILVTVKGATQDGATQNIYDAQNATKNTKTAGGWVFGVLALGGLAAWGFSKMKDKK